MSKEQDFTFQHPQPQGISPYAGQQEFNPDGTLSMSPTMLELSSLGQKLPPQPRVNFNTDIIGLFQTVSVAPTQTPVSPYQQIQIYVNSTTYRLYVYDNTAGVWHYATLT